jgi:hypothetical protein
MRSTKSLDQPYGLIGLSSDASETGAPPAGLPQTAAEEGNPADPMLPEHCVQEVAIPQCRLGRAPQGRDFSLTPDRSSSTTTL